MNGFVAFVLIRLTIYRESISTILRKMSSQIEHVLLLIYLPPKKENIFKRGLKLNTNTNKHAG